MSHSNNIFSNQEELVTSSDKENLLSHKGLVIWMTGYSGSGKTTLAYQLERRLHDEGILTKVLDGDAAVANASVTDVLAVFNIAGSGKGVTVVFKILEVYLSLLLL